MGRILVVAEITTTGTEARERVISHLEAASIYAKGKEPGVYKYMICLPAEDDSKTVWAIEEYADKKALDSHMEIPPVKEVIAYMSSNPVFQGSGPKIHQLSWLEGMDFTKPEVSQQKDLYVVFADIELIAGKRDDTLRYWQGNLDSSSEESGCFVYGFAQDSEKPDHLFSLEAYESESYLWDVHFKAAAVQETIQKTKDLRKNLTLAKLKFHSGFVYKDNASSTT